MTEREEERPQHDDADEVTRRNVAGMRELLAQQEEQEQAREAEPPLTDEPHVVLQDDRLPQEAADSPGRLGRIRGKQG